MQLIAAGDNPDRLWLNWIECEFTALRYVILDGSDYPSHTAQETAIARYIR
ncbi:hypothetical protein [Actinosynnema sp. ALI-1.44]|uniref:hypothetical protein n=1 Tax=Actinosynnema sp. ALI-1.44 TaxID=1933779 RepID=UPI001EDB5198|nr:hypothetical protein [Actinosynnema sp. ALI-1.44]